MIIFIALGIIASIFQLVVLREFSFSIAKNELAFVVAAGFWIIACSLGSIINIRKKLSYLLLPVLACVCFSASICMIHLSKSLAGLKYYEAANLKLILFLSIALIGPVAFIIGQTFRYLVQEYIQNNPARKNIYAKFFAFEAMGFFLGGTVFTFYLSSYINPLIFSLAPLILLPYAKNHSKKSLSAVIIIIITLISTASFNSILKKEFNNSNISLNLGSCYGPVIATVKAGATTFFSEGSLLATSEDKSAVEEFIHMSLSAAGPFIDKDILFIGAALSGQVEEITKYKLNSLDCLQINPLISKLAQNKSPAGTNHKINFITDDPRLYLKNTNKQYDAILMNMPAPSNLALNRYFTKEFFKLIIRRLKTNAVFSFTIPSKREILSPQFSRFNSSIINAIDKVFPNRLIIPSDSMIILASNEQKITPGWLLDNFTRTNPKLEFFTAYHFKDYLEPSMRDYAENKLDKKISANTDLNPSGFLNYLILEQIKFYPNLKIDFKKAKSAVILFLLLCGILIITVSYLSKKVSCLLNIWAVGFSSIGLSSIIFVLLQIYCGALFWKLGLLIALFMAGISAGTFFTGKIKAYPVNPLSVIYTAWIIIAYSLFLNLKIIGNLNHADFIFYLYSLLCGFITGCSYPILAQSLINNKFKNENITTAVYSADLTGAFIGTLACGIFLIPLLGIPNSLLTLLFLNAIFALKNLRN